MAWCHSACVGDVVLRGCACAPRGPFDRRVTRLPDFWVAFRCGHPPVHERLSRRFPARSPAVSTRGLGAWPGVCPNLWLTRLRKLAVFRRHPKARPASLRFVELPQSPAERAQRHPFHVKHCPRCGLSGLQRSLRSLCWTATTRGLWRVPRRPRGVVPKGSLLIALSPPLPSGLLLPSPPHQCLKPSPKT